MTGLRSVAAPLAVRMRPLVLGDVVGQGHLLQPGSPIRALANPDSRAHVSVILWGPPGSGKTTLAHVVAGESGREFVELSAITAGVKDVREVMERARVHADLYGTRTLLFLDEIHRFSKAQQDALLPGVENGWVTLIAATTENPSFSVITPLLSRSLLLTLNAVGDADIAGLLDRAVSAAQGLADSVVLVDEARQALVGLSAGDARRALTALEAVASLAIDAADQASGDTPVRVTAEHVQSAVDRALLRYDRQGDQHYDVISAFIKSIRGSDPDAAVHYLARMIEAGEDPRFIARRLVISAAEDVGLADPAALSIATAAADAVAFIGMPEGRIPLAEATIYLATAPKSNTAYTAINSAIADVRAGKAGEVPKHLRDGSYPGAKALGHGQGYRYPHDDERGVVEQQYAPEPLVSTRYYRPTARGYEQRVAARLERVLPIVHDRPVPQQPNPS
ncbi:MAG TPA: replication-associated recombination protein A [Microbacteriaceae bacterium]|nr:replication-associated recombination protein A [Microbacteriaceae bacterium]